MSETSKGNITEESLAKLINSDKCRSVRIDGKNYWISKKVKNEIKNHPKYKEGGFAFLAAIPAIIAGLAGAAGVASGVASTIASSRQAIKTQKETELLGSGIYLKKDENNGSGLYLKNGSGAVKGKGIYLKPYEGSAIHKYLKNIFDDSELKDSTKKFKDGIEIEILKDHKGQGDGLYLKPYNYYSKNISSSQNISSKNGHSDED